MCGRYTYLFKWKQLHRLMRLLEWPQDELVPRYNVAPTQRAPVVCLGGSGQRIGEMMQWGLIPSWAKDPAADSRPCNARGESMFDKPTFRSAAKQQRCLVPVSGFYEWQAVEGEKAKQPYWIGREDREPIVFGGLWESWQDREHPNAPSLRTFTIVTTTPNPLMASLHDRMPVVLAEDEWEQWLDLAAPQASVQALIRAYSGDDLIAFPVSRAVNSPKSDVPALMERVAPPESAPGLFG